MKLTVLIFVIFFQSINNLTLIQLKTSPPLLLLIRKDLAVIPAQRSELSLILTLFYDYFFPESANRASGQQIYFHLMILLVCALIVTGLVRK